MPVFFTADLHFGHANICACTGRPYASVDAMNDGLVELWSEVVGEGDEVWILGDLALGKIAETLPLVGRLPGRKILVPGNHDRCWLGSKSPDRWRYEYLAAGVSEIVDAPAAVTLPGGIRILVDHFPYQGDSGPLDRYEKWRPADRGGWLLHGHVHDRWRQRGRQINVGVDAWGGRPVPASELAEMVAGGPTDAAPLPWPAPAGVASRFAPDTTPAGEMI